MRNSTKPPVYRYKAINKNTPKSLGFSAFKYFLQTLKKPYRMYLSVKNIICLHAEAFFILSLFIQHGICYCCLCIFSMFFSPSGFLTLTSILPLISSMVFFIFILSIFSFKALITSNSSFTILQIST